MDEKKHVAVYKVAVPSVYQTSEHLRFEWAARPPANVRAKPTRVGIGHTVHVSKFVYNHVWSAQYVWSDQRFTKSFGTAKQALSYNMTTLSTNVTPRDAPSPWAWS